MFSKTTFAQTIIFATASAAFAATKQHGAPSHDVYDTRGAYVGSDPDSHVRFELRRDWERDQQ
jgi:hypothetical protein